MPWKQPARAERPHIVAERRPRLAQDAEPRSARRDPQLGQRKVERAWLKTNAGLRR